MPPHVHVGGARPSTVRGIDILEEEDPCWGFEAPTPPALNIARRSHASVRLHDGTVLVTGGSTDRGMRADEIYDPAQNR